jgi:type III secretion system low calcium response chaperone LcrH/SycD
MKNSHENEAQIRKETLSEAEKQSREFDKGLTLLTTKMFKEGKTPSETLGVNKEVMESIYAQAYRLYNTGKYEEAIHLFRILIMMNSNETKYLLGLAACFHMIKEYESAIQTYTLCSACDAENPLPHYHISDCFIQLKDLLSAMISLELAIARTEGKQEYSKIRERALLSLESLKAQLTTQSSL